VARLVAVAVVDGLEPVEVEVAHGHGAAGLLGLAEAPVGLGLEAAPVREPGERVGVGQHQRPRLGLLVLADVHERDGQPAPEARRGDAEPAAPARVGRDAFSLTSVPRASASPRRSRSSGASESGPSARRSRPGWAPNAWRAAAFANVTLNRTPASAPSSRAGATSTTASRELPITASRRSLLDRSLGTA